MGRTRPTDSSIPQARPFVTWYFVRWRTFWVGRGARKRPGALPAGLEACGGGFWPSCVAKKDAAASEVPAIRTVPETNSKPSAAGSSWKGGARERREKSGAPVRERPILSGADFAPTWSECGDSNPGPPAPKAGALPTAQHPVISFRRRPGPHVQRTRGRERTGNLYYTYFFPLVKCSMAFCPDGGKIGPGGVRLRGLGVVCVGEGNFIRPRTAPVLRRTGSDARQDP